MATPGSSPTVISPNSALTSCATLGKSLPLPGPCLAPHKGGGILPESSRSSALLSAPLCTRHLVLGLDCLQVHFPCGAEMP